MKTLILAMLIGFTAIACTDRNADDGYNPQLPPITQTGANTFGAIINGKVMVPRNSIGYAPPGNTHYAVRYSRWTNYEQIEAGDPIANRGYIYVY